MTGMGRGCCLGVVLGLVWAHGLAGRACAIGPQNVLVITSQKSADGQAIANYYCRERGIPPINIVRTRLGIDNDQISDEKFQKYLVEFAENHIERYGLRDRISVWVTTVHTPAVVQSNNSCSGVIFFGNYEAPTAMGDKLAAFARENPYFDLVNGWRRPKETTSGGYLHMRLDAGSVVATRALIDRSIRADGSFPKGTVYLFDGEGPRSVRKEAIAPAKRFLGMLGIATEHRPGWSLSGAKDVLGWHTGIPALNAKGNDYVPGALADHLTSFGGTLRPHRGQTPAMDFLVAGCSATYGTVVEPLALPPKFPLAQVYAYYGMGFTAVESYWMSVLWPQQGLFLGDPLTRPFEKSPTVEVIGLAREREVKGTFDFEVSAETALPGPGVRKLTVYVDRKMAYQRVFNEVPEGTKVSARLAGKQAEFAASKGMSATEFVLGLGKAIGKSGLQASVKPGLIVVFLPPSEKGEEAPTIRSTSPLLSAEILGKSVGAPTKSGASMAWTLKGKSGEGDRLVLTIREGEKERPGLVHVVTFPRPAGSVCTSLWLEGNKGLPAGYRLEKNLDVSKPELGTIRLVTDPAVVKETASASLKVEPSTGSTLTISDEGATKTLASVNPMGANILGLRFGLGSPKLRIRPQVDTSKFADGRHVLEIVAQRGSSTESASLKSIPIVVKNGEKRLRVEGLMAESSMKTTSKVAVAKAVLPE